MKRILIVLAALACMAISCNTSSSTTANADTSSSNMSSSNTDMLERNKQTALACQQGVTNHDADAVFKDAAPDYTDYGDGSFPPSKGVDSAKKGFETFLAAFPDMKGENFTTIAEGNHVAVIGDWSGTFKGELMGMKPTGKSFKVKDVDIFTFNDEGKITEHRSIQSFATMFAQVGATMPK